MHTLTSSKEDSLMGEGGHPPGSENSLGKAKMVLWPNAPGKLNGFEGIGHMQEVAYTASFRRDLARRVKHPSRWDRCSSAAGIMTSRVDRFSNISRLSMVLGFR